MLEASASALRLRRHIFVCLITEPAEPNGSPRIRTFTNKWPRLHWAVSPLIFMAVVKRRYTDGTSECTKVWV
jgi:hypothetical protein